jgi:hypothetical protein
MFLRSVHTFLRPHIPSDSTILNYVCKVAGSIPDEVTGFFNLHMALGSTQTLTEMSTRNLSRGEGWPACKADNLTVIYEPIVWKMWEPRRLRTQWASTACYILFYVVSVLTNLYLQKSTRSQLSLLTKPQGSKLVFGRYSVLNSTDTPAIVAEGSHSFP